MRLECRFISPNRISMQNLSVIGVNKTKYKSQKLIDNQQSNIVISYIRISISDT